MKKIKHILVLMFVLMVFGQSLYAQNSNTNDIQISPYLSSEIDVPTGAQATLLNKLNQILTKNGTVNETNALFILTANVTTLSKDVTPTMPPMQSYTFQVSFYLGNGIDGNVFSTYSLTAKGVGTNELKAYNNAFQNINIDNVGFANFLASGKAKIINYYNTKCGAIQMEAAKLEKLGDYTNALSKLAAIPSSSSCYGKSMAKIESLYKKVIDLTCKTKLNEAQQIWNANPTASGATEVANILRDINPASACFSDVRVLGKTISAKMNENDAREWKLYYEKEVGLEKSRIEALKEIGKAYGNGQAKVVNYNTKGWW